MTPWTAVQARRFSRAYKKLDPQARQACNQAVTEVLYDPRIGRLKRGDLASLRVHKFKAGARIFLLGYTLDTPLCLVYLQAVGPRENYYPDLKKSLSD